MNSTESCERQLFSVILKESHFVNKKFGWEFDFSNAATGRLTAKENFSKFLEELLFEILTMHVIVFDIAVGCKNFSCYFTKK